MAIKINVQYGHPTDPDAFEKYYAETHLPLAAQMTGVSRMELCKVVGTPDGSPSDVYRTAELWWDSPEDMQKTMGSPEGQATVADLANFATGGVNVFISTVD
ncbi:EthD family reductase [Sporichthya brevicatena]|uniref:EthD family reductase n=1 Tax=Sporichthya brevicatena TaxID=171442 RepID=A0ABP3SH54_9ACTN